ncbi:MAG: hypothetical protein GVY19_11240 [Bacteroidetes bacterium]|jgi:hypothetical protein|nr:hypothetical protein [Bacteroidota bacterium]
MNEKEIYTAIEALQKAAPVKANWFESNKPAGYGNLLIENNKKKYTFTVELKKELRTINIPKLAVFKENYNNFLVIARVIYPNIGKQLQELQINYVDTLGNIFIQQGELLLLINGDKAPVRTVNNTGRAFNKAGLRFIFNLLTREDFLQKTYREMAVECETALGNINYIVKDLQEQGYLIKKNKKNWLLNNREALIVKWAENYIIKLQPDIQMGAFRFQYPEGMKNWMNLKIDYAKTHWGGEPAADILTNYLQPATLTLYTKENRIDLVKKYRLIPDTNGNIKLFTKFWKTTAKTETVHPLIIYADLIGIRDPRTVELANMIYNEYLKEQF